MSFEIDAKWVRFTVIWGFEPLVLSRVLSATENGLLQSEKPKLKLFENKVTS